MSEQSLSDSLALLNDQGLGRLLGSWLLETLQMRLSACVVPEFWSGLKQPENEMEEKDRVWVLLTAFRTLLDRLEPFLGEWTIRELMGFLCEQHSNFSSSLQLVWRSWGRGRMRAAEVCVAQDPKPSRSEPSPPSGPSSSSPRLPSSRSECWSFTAGPSLSI